MIFETPDGVELYFDDTGAGDAVFLIHGAAASGMALEPLAAELQGFARAITVDLRGLSRSQRVESVGPSTWGDDVISLADYLGLGSFNVIGCSLGGRIAARLAFDHAERVRRLAVDAPLLSVRTVTDDALDRRFEQLDDPSERDYDRWTRFHGEDWREAVSFYGRVRKDTALQDYLTTRPFLQELTLPTLITRGDIDDNIHALRDAEDWHHAHPSTSWMWIAPNTSYSLTQEAPRQYADVYRRFLAST